MMSSPWWFLPAISSAAFSSVMRAGGGGEAGVRLALRAILPGFVVFALALFAVERGGAPAFLPWLGIAGILAGAVWGRRSRTVVGALRDRAGVGDDPEATVTKFEGRMRRLTPWSEAEERTSGLIARGAAGVIVTVIDGQGGRFAPDRVVETEDGFDLSTDGGRFFLVVDSTEPLAESHKGLSETPRDHPDHLSSA